MLSPFSRRKGWQNLPFVYKTTTRNILPQNTCPCVQPLITNRNLAGKTEESFVYKKSLKTLIIWQYGVSSLGPEKQVVHCLELFLVNSSILFFNFTFFFFFFFGFSKFTSFFLFLFGGWGDALSLDSMLTWTDDHFHSL